MWAQPGSIGARIVIATMDCFKRPSASRAGREASGVALAIKATAIALLLAGLAPAQSPAELADLAARAMQRQDYAAAEVAYQRLVEHVPDMAQLHSNLGLACLLQQKIPCAEESFKNALELDEGLFLPNISLAQMRFQQRNYAEATQFAEQAVRLEPDVRESRELLIAALAGLDRLDRVAEEFGQLLQRNPQDSEALYGLGSAYLELSLRVTESLKGHSGSGYEHLVAAERDAGDPQWRAAALNSYNDAFAQGVGTLGPRVAYARLQMADGQWNEAVSSLQSELKHDPYSYEGRFWLALAELHEADTEACVRLLNEAMEIRPEFFEPLPDLPIEIPPDVAADLRATLLEGEKSFGMAYLLSHLEPQRDGANSNQAWLKTAIGFRNAALESLRTQNEYPPTEQFGLHLLQRKRYEQGLDTLQPLVSSHALGAEALIAFLRSLVRAGRFEKMFELFRSREPETAEEVYLLGTSYKLAGIKYLERMVRADPDSPRAHQVLGDSYMAQRRFERALEEYELATELSPDDATYHYLVASALHRMMEFGRAAEAFARVTELDASNAEAHILRGECLAQIGRTDEAIDSIQKGLSLRPDLAQAHIAMGKVFRMAGNDAMALKHLTLGVKGDSDGSVHYQLYLLYRKLNRLEEARTALARSQELRRGPKTDAR